MVQLLSKMYKPLRSYSHISSSYPPPLLEAGTSPDLGSSGISHISAGAQGRLSTVLLSLQHKQQMINTTRITNNPLSHLFDLGSSARLLKQSFIHLQSEAWDNIPLPMSEKAQNISLQSENKGMILKILDYRPKGERSLIPISGNCHGTFKVLHKPWAFTLPAELQSFSFHQL